MRANALCQTHGQRTVFYIVFRKLTKADYADNEKGQGARFWLYVETNYRTKKKTYEGLLVEI